MNNDYQRWLAGEGCCNSNYVKIEPCDKHKDVCDCDNILLEISKLQTNDEVLQEQIDELSGCCSGGSGGCECDLSDYYTIEEVDDIADDIREEIPVVPTNVSAFINDMGYLTEHQPLSGYVTNAEFIQVTSNLQQQIDSLRSAISGCCGQTGQTYTRWITMTGENDYWCSGTTKMSKEKEQTSTDNVNWVDTGNIRNGNTALEYNSTSCGYVPPTPTAATTPRIYNLYEPSKTNVKILYQCPTSSVKEITYKNTGMWRHISACTTNLSVALDVDQDSFNVIFKTNSETIENYMFKDTDISGTISTHRVTTIGNGAYENCTGLTRAYLNGNSVGRINLVSIGNDVFKNCFSMLSVDLSSNTIVPTLGTGVFDGCTSLVAIYVNNSLVNTYKTSPGWSAYADKIIGLG